MPRTTKKETKTPALQSVEQVWLAGLGALATAEDEGTKMFRTLVRRGEGFEKDSRARLRKAMTRTRAQVDDLRETTLGRMETRIEGGVDTVLGRIGVPTRRDLAKLTRRVESLTDAVQKSRTPTRRRTPRRKAAAAETTPTA
jgi:poly(hydroxyalkanoate) granule-associated protein